MVVVMIMIMATILSMPVPLTLALPLLPTDWPRRPVIRTVTPTTIAVAATRVFLVTALPHRPWPVVDAAHFAAFPPEPLVVDDVFRPADARARGGGVFCLCFFCCGRRGGGVCAAKAEDKVRLW